MAMLFSREAIWTSLFDLLHIAPFKHYGRKVPESWSALPEYPGLFLLSGWGHYPPRMAVDLDPVVMMPGEIFLINRASDQPDIDPIVQVNALVDAVEAAITPPEGVGHLTLNGLVGHCFIEGTIEGNPGDVGGIGVVKIPLSILVNH